MKKKLLGMLLLIILIFSMAGCQKDKIDTTDSGSVETSKATEVEIKKETSKDAKVENAQDTIEFELGNIDGDTYSSKFSGIQCTVPEGWIYYSSDQMKELNGNVYDELGDEDIKEALKNGDVIYDMYVINKFTGQNINVVIENMGFVNGRLLNEASYFDQSEKQIKISIEGMGYNEVATERNTVDMAGKKREGLALTAMLQELPMYQQLIAIQKGNYMICITFTCFEENTLPEMMGYFKEL